MLYLYQSNRLEDLAALLGQVHQVRPLSQALASEEIMVQSQGMRRFLEQFLAREYGISANLRFNLPASFHWKLMRHLLPDMPALNPFHPEVMRWRLFALFSDGTLLAQYPQVKAALSDYLSSGSEAAYQLSGQLADIFDQYLVYRTDWVQAWQKGKLLGLGEAEIWQAQLWRFLDDGLQVAPHRADMWQQLVEKLRPDVLPERISVFGIATLAPMYVQLLQVLSKHTQVHVFALNPCAQFWGNVIEPAQILANRNDSDLSQTGHPLLASWGKQGRDFFDALTEMGAQSELSVYADEATSSSVLHQIQWGIQSLILPEDTKNTQLDQSIRMVSAHSPRRELQILKDHLCQLLADNPSWQPHDIAVLTPDIAPYFPYIEAIFGGTNHQEPALPYSVSDVKLSKHQPLLHTIEHILALFDSRFEVDKVLLLLDSEPILRRFKLTREDLPLIHDTIAALNIHWGTDETMRQNNDLYTWQQGIDRLILGWLQPQSDSLWQQLSAWHTNPNHITVLSRFAKFIRTLIQHHRLWQHDTDINDWANRIRQLQNDLTQADEHDQTALQQFEQALTQWQQEAQLAQFHNPLPQRIIITHISRFLTSQSQAGFLRGGITFCSMVPMRSLPFKAICLLGLNDNTFPRHTQSNAFDLIAQHPKRGDRARRNDDCYLFLECLISAREHLYLSYIGRSNDTNKELAPSALIDELIDTIVSMTHQSNDTTRHTLIEQHPLQAFSTRYFQANSHLQSTRQDYAQALNTPTPPQKPFFDTPLDFTPPNEINQNQLIQFWRNPLKYWLKQHLNWQAPYSDPAWESAEPFVSPHHTTNIHAYIHDRQHHQDFTHTSQQLTAQSMLPPEYLGKQWQEHYISIAQSLDGEYLNSPKLPSLPYQYSDGITTLNGSLEHLHQHGQIFLSRFQNKPSHTEKTQRLLQHLIYNAITPDTHPNRHSHWLDIQSETYPPIPQQTAQNLLNQWLKYYRIGQTQPLPYMPKTSYQSAQVWLKGKTEEESRQKVQEEAYKQYMGSKGSKGQKEYLEVAQFDDNNDTKMIDNPLFFNIIIDVIAPTLKACGLS